MEYMYVIILHRFLKNRKKGHMTASFKSNQYTLNGREGERGDRFEEIP